MEKKKVLIVEDEALTQKFLAQIIEALGYVVDSCDNGEEAIDKINKFQPDVILSDVLMPEFSGLQLLNYVQKKILADIPILLISSLDPNVMQDMVKDVGAVGFISKPPQKEDLAKMLALALA